MKSLSLLLIVSLFLGCLPVSAAEIPVEEVLVESLPVEEIPLEEVTTEEIPVEEVPLPDTPSEQEPPAPMMLALPASGNTGPGLYFGQLHAHTELSGGYGTPEEAYLHARDTADLDFLAVTDHSDSFDNASSAEIGEDASTVSEKWAQGKAAAKNATTDSFVGIYGYEMSWPRQKQLGHISTFATPGFQSWDQEAFASSGTGLSSYYDVLATVPESISQFNHPGTLYGSFSDFSHYSEEIDRVITLLEVGSGEGAVGGPGYFSAYDAYTRALDKGWHLAPTNNQGNHQGGWGTANTARTAVFAQSLTETGIYEALRQYRTYATEDSDLEIRYSMDGHFMGSRLKLRQIGEWADISVSLLDPTDDAIGLVEVIVEGGESAASQQVETPSADIAFSLSPEYPYYYLRITQPDGDTAVTAPIWVEQEEELGISGLACETTVPVQGEAAQLTLSLYNREASDFLVDGITILRDVEVIAKDTGLSKVSAGSALTYDLTVSHEKPGTAQFLVRLCGTLEGAPREYEAAIDLFFRQSSRVRNILVDGTHGNAGTDALTRLTALAAEENIRVTVIREAITPEMLENCGILLVSAPAKPFSAGFLSLVREYSAYGGTIVVCGQADSLGSGSAHLNRLLRALGSTMILRDDQARDTVHNGGTDTLLFTPEINSDADWCENITESQTYRQELGCTVDPGSGTWLVKGRTTTDSLDGDKDGSGGSEAGTVTLLAAESLPGGGTVFAAGSLFLSDAELEEPKNLWDQPYANHTIARNLLGMAPRPLPLGTIRQARDAASGTLLRVRGHVTAGTSNPHNTFPETLYLQDDTGGIAITGFTAEGINVGTAIEITGTMGSDGFNTVLAHSDHTVLKDDFYRYLPQTGDWDTLLDPDLHGGELVQVEGTCSDTLLSSDGTLSEFTVTDTDGHTARVLIEAGIGSLSTGENTLHEVVIAGRTIRAVGLLHRDTDSTIVVRVRDCEEVVYVPPETAPLETVPPETAKPMEYVNPKTGDPLFRFLPGLAAGFCLLSVQKEH